MTRENKLIVAGGWEIYVLTNDHQPPHCHVIHPDRGWEIRIDISDDFNVMTAVTRNKILTKSGIRTAVELAKRNKYEIGKEWRRIYGN